MDENQLSYLVIGTVIEVHRQLDPGLLENVYKECLAQALIGSGINVQPKLCSGRRRMSRTICISWVNPALENHLFGVMQ